MKAFVCALLVVLLFNNAAASGRSLTQVTARASVSSRGGGSASAVAKASGDGSKPTTADATSIAVGNNADASTTAVAKDGADVSGTTVAKSKDGAKVSGTTNVVGEGDVKVDAALFVEGEKDDVIDVTVYRSRVEKGGNIQDIAAVIVKDFEQYKYSRVVTALIALASDPKTLPLYDACVALLFQQRGCDNFKLIVASSARQLIVYKVPNDIAACIYPPCSGFGSAKSCCGKAQLAQDQCACKDGHCSWKQPAQKNGFVPYWICDKCAEKVDLCTC